MILTDPNSFFPLGKEEEILILSKNMLLLLRTQNMHLKKISTQGFEHSYAITAAPSPETTILCFCCQKCQAKDYKCRRNGFSWGTHKEREAFIWHIVVCALGDK